ncbi:MAG: hypothetical protein AAF542_08570 [Pseudomonadota bacterium]
MLKTVGVFLGYVSIAACSNSQIYEASRQNAEQECQELPQNQYEQCMAEVAEPYDSYSRKREEVMNEK